MNLNLALEGASVNGRSCLLNVSTAARVRHTCKSHKKNVNRKQRAR
jgi:hypothetical protein